MALFSLIALSLLSLIAIIAANDQLTLSCVCAWPGFA